MGIIARIFDFVAGTKIRSADIDAELNQLVSAHNDHDTKIDGLQAGTGLTNGAVTNSKVATGIDMVKLADGSVTNTEVQFINSLTSNAQNQLDAKIPLTQKGAALGVAPLDSSAKINEIYLPDSVLGQLDYQSTYNAATNTPAIPAASTANKGWFYIVNAAGTFSSISYDVGDWIVSNGSAWQKVDNTDAVSSFNGRLGAILPATGDYDWAQIDKTTSSLLDLATRSASDLNTGTLPVGRVPTGIPATSIGTGAIDNAHLNFLADVTGLIQAQLNAKAPLTHVGAGGIAQHPDATTSQSGFISVADLIAFRALTPTGLGSYSVPVGQVFPFWSRYSQEQDPVTGEMVFYEI